MTACTCTTPDPYKCLQEERGIPYASSVAAGGCKCRLCDHDEWPKPCACKHADAHLCAMRDGHSFLERCVCRCHKQPAKRVPSPVGDLSYNEEGWPAAEGDAE